MNKIKAIIVILVVSLSFTGCSFGGTNNVIFSVIRSGYSLWKEKNKGNENDKKVENPNDYGKIVLKAIENEDVESIRNIMCPYIRENFKSLDDDIKGMFEFIDGKIISYDGPGLDPAGGYEDDGEFILEHYCSWIHDLKTDTGHIYDIKVPVTKVDTKHEGYEGVTEIIVIELEREGTGKVYHLGYEEMYMDE